MYSTFDIVEREHVVEYDHAVKYDNDVGHKHVAKNRSETPQRAVLKKQGASVVSNTSMLFIKKMRFYTFYNMTCC